MIPAFTPNWFKPATASPIYVQVSCSAFNLAHCVLTNIRAAHHDLGSRDPTRQSHGTATGTEIKDSQSAAHDALERPLDHVFPRREPHADSRSTERPEIFIP